MAVQRNAHRYALAEQRPHPVEMPTQEQRERCHVERLCDASASSSCSRDNALTSRATARKPSTPARRCVAASALAFAIATRAMPSKKRQSSLAREGDARQRMPVFGQFLRLLPSGGGISAFVEVS